jgi:pimeloyl-ACP methyl ester carboxylesterase
MATWLRHWMEQVNLHDVDLVGHSMGGYIALSLAVSAPELVRHLVLVDPAGLRPKKGALRYAVPLLREVRSMRPSFLPILVADAVRAGPMSILRTAGELLQQDIGPHLTAVRVPTLLLWGERDALVPRSLGEILHREIAHSRLIVISGAGHVPMYDNPTAVAEAILTFLEETDCRG